MHLCESAHKQPNTNATRISVAFLWLYVLVLGISYSSNLTAFLTISRQPREVDTFEDLYNSGLNVVGLGNIFGILMNNSGNVYLKVCILSHFEAHNVYSLFFHNTVVVDTITNTTSYKHLLPYQRSTLYLSPN